MLYCMVICWFLEGWGPGRSYTLTLAAFPNVNFDSLDLHMYILDLSVIFDFKICSKLNCPMVFKQSRSNKTLLDQRFILSRLYSKQRSIRTNYRTNSNRTNSNRTNKLYSNKHIRTNKLYLNELFSTKTFRALSLERICILLTALVCCNF